MKLKFKKNNFLIRWYPVVVPVAFLVVIVFIIWPTLLDIGKLRDDIILEQEKLEKSYLKGQSLRKAQESVQSIQSELDRLEELVMYPGDELMFITSLEQTANNNQVTQVISMDDLIPGIVNLTALPVQVDVSGKFTDLLKYLQAVEVYPFYINWKTVDFTTSSRLSLGRRLSGQQAPLGGFIETNKGTQVRMQLKGESFWRPLRD